MIEHSTPRLANPPAIYVKWLVFGVALPLLPLSARLLAYALNPLGNSLTFKSLFGDGELLVIATVIAAAAIGDLLFDTSTYNEPINRIQGAILCAFALLVVVVSVLIYGLVALRVTSRFSYLSYIGEQNAAVLSVTMFLISLLVGAAAARFSIVGVIFKPKIIETSHETGDT